MLITNLLASWTGECTRHRLICIHVPASAIARAPFAFMNWWVHSQPLHWISWTGECALARALFALMDLWVHSQQLLGFHGPVSAVITAQLAFMDWWVNSQPLHWLSWTGECIALTRAMLYIRGPMNALTTARITFMDRWVPWQWLSWTGACTLLSSICIHGPVSALERALFAF